MYLKKLSDEFPREVNDQCPADRAETAEKLLDVMAANGVDQAVLTQIGGTQLEHHRVLTALLEDLSQSLPRHWLDPSRQMGRARRPHGSGSLRTGIL